MKVATDGFKLHKNLLGKHEKKSPKSSQTNFSTAQFYFILTSFMKRNEISLFKLWLFGNRSHLLYFFCVDQLKPLLTIFVVWPSLRFHNGIWDQTKRLFTSCLWRWFHGVFRALSKMKIFSSMELLSLYQKPPSWNIWCFKEF